WGSSSHVGVGVNTAFAVLFLTRSTAQVVGTPVPADPIGGGLQKGGRGLSFDGLGGEKPKQPLAELDDLLDKLSAAGDFTIEEVQEQIVKQVQIGDKEALIERKDLLVEYVQHPDAEVRRTAVWALGRTNDLSLAKHLITALDDQDLGVIIEARNALCWLSRKPTGLGEAADPFEDLPEDATAEQRSSAIAAWHAELIRKWGEWYLEHRPYKDRGDEFEANLLRKIAEAGG
ncbi:MAG: HEAT repeat domain-containing protein, partial [Planctomycetota bacterium]